jgi:2-oxo-3-hexenedioate decarboxylase/2-keto-4-pentenoate hydratase
MQKFVGVDHPCEGAIFASRVHRGPVTLKAGDYVRIAVEAEIAVRLGRDLGPDGAPYDRAGVARAVAACMAAIELVDDRQVEYERLDGPLLIADNAFNFGCVLGPEVADWQGLDLAALAGRMRINGETVGEGVGADVMGHPFEALAFLANSLVRRGKPLASGQVVMTGSIVATKFPKAGDEVVSEIDGLGEARVRFV